MPSDQDWHWRKRQNKQILMCQAWEHCVHEFRVKSYLLFGKILTRFMLMLQSIQNVIKVESSSHALCWNIYIQAIFGWMKCFENRAHRWPRLTYSMITNGLFWMMKKINDTLLFAIHFFHDFWCCEWNETKFGFNWLRCFFVSLMFHPMGCASELFENKSRCLAKNSSQNSMNFWRGPTPATRRSFWMST